LSNRSLAPFIAVFQTELRFNLKRVAPYALMLIFSANAVLWWGWGPAVSRGWAVNSDFYIVWLLGGFSFMTMPIFIALMMGDPVIRDFRLGIDPLIFSKPVSRAEYLLGKFCGNFLVLICCQFCFALTALLLQGFSTRGMIVLSPRLLPYVQHFLFFVVVTSLALGAVCFTVGTLTRNVKLVYGMVLSSYFLYIAWQETIKGLPERWRVALDPLLFNVGAESWKGRSADWLNQLSVGYDGVMIINRALMCGVALLCLAMLYFRFRQTARDEMKPARQLQTLGLNLTPEAVSLDRGTESSGPVPLVQVAETVTAGRMKLPQVTRVTEGLRACAEQFAAALGVEFRLLRAERSLIVVAPLVIFMCILELAAFKLVPDGSYSAIYASRMTDALLLFLFGVAVFYAGETMHRDRETRIEPLLWSAPAPNFVLLLSKFAATLLLSLSLVTLAAVTAICVQLAQGHAPLLLSIYLKTCVVILLPSVLFMIAASVSLNVLLRDKYLAYAVSLAIGGAVYYLSGQSHNSWLYNPVLYRLWTPADLMGGGHLTRILAHRIYFLSLSTLLVALALLFHERKSNREFRAQRRLSERGWSLLVALASVIIAVITGLIVMQTA
jgi:ABC-type transport system involved in multi-copper enzyme maturation permease subunit